MHNQTYTRMLLHILHIVNSAYIYITHANCSKKLQTNNTSDSIIALALKCRDTAHEWFQILPAVTNVGCPCFQLLQRPGTCLQWLQTDEFAANISPCPKWYLGRWEPHKVAQSSYKFVKFITDPPISVADYWLVGKTWRHLRFWSHYPHRWAFSRLSSVVALCYPTCWSLAREAHRWPPEWFKPKAVKSTNIPKWTAHLELKVCPTWP